MDDKCYEYLRMKLWCDIVHKFYSSPRQVNEVLEAADKAIQEFDKRFKEYEQKKL